MRSDEADALEASFHENGSKLEQPSFGRVVWMTALLGFQIMLGVAVTGFLIGLLVKSIVMTCEALSC